MVKRLHRLHPEPVVDTMALAMTYGTLEMARWVMKHRHDVCCSEPRSNDRRGKRSPCCIRWDGTNVNEGEASRMLRWLVQKCTGPSFRIVSWAAANGDFDSVRWVLNRPGEWKNDSWGNTGLVAAAITGHLEVVRLLRDNQVCRSYELEESVAKALVQGHDDVVAVLSAALGEGSHPWHRKISVWAAAAGRLDLLQRDDIRRPLESGELVDDAMRAAYASGHLHVMQWLFAEYGVARSCLTRVKATAPTTKHTEGLRMDILVWLESIGVLREKCAMNAIVDAASDGFLGIIKWFHSDARYTSRFTTAVMDEAAAAGRLNVVKWLHENRTEGCTSAAMDMAAANGHLDVVVFLHENRHEGCTVSAFGNAPLDVAMWLHRHRSEGFRSLAVKNAVKRGDLASQFLIETVAVEFGPRVFAPYELRHFGVARWLKVHHPEAINYPPPCRCLRHQRHNDVYELAPSETSPCFWFRS